METFIKANVEALGMRMENFDLPSDIDSLIETTKDSISSQKDPRIQKLFVTLRLFPEVTTLKEVLDYLTSNTYAVDLEMLKKIIKGKDS